MQPTTLTLPDFLLASAARGDGEFVFHLEDGRVRLPLSELAARARIGASALAARGVGRGDTVGILGPNRPEWVVAACSIWAAGAAVVPIQIPLRVRDPAAFSEQIGAVLRTAGCRLVLADGRLVSMVPGGAGARWDAYGDAAATPPTPPTPEDAAVIQFTSGSTASPKGAVIPHGAVLAQLSMLEELNGRPASEETSMGWAPFFHDLGLILFIAWPAAHGGTAHILPAECFARDPAKWLRLVDATRATVTVGPASALGAALRALQRRSEPIDLGSLRVAWFAAEGVDPDVVDRLTAEGGRLGLDRGAVGATYGLAEAVLAVTTTRPGEGLRFDVVDLGEITTSGRALPANGGAARRVACCGRPPTGVELRIVGDGEDLGERQVGEVYVRTPAVMRCYTGEAASPFVDGWLRTGDVGYLADGELHVTGRLKDMVIVMGHNYYPEDFEWAAGRVTGVRQGRCVAFAADGSEEVVLLVEPRADADVPSLPRRVRDAVANAVGVAPGEVLVLPAGTVEKTTSGKLRRGTMRDAYARGELPSGDLAGAKSR